jgi:hypothetical protein
MITTDTMDMVQEVGRDWWGDCAFHSSRATYTNATQRVGSFSWCLVRCTEVFGARHELSVVQCSVFGVSSLMFGAGCEVFGARCLCETQCLNMRFARGRSSS